MKLRKKLQANFVIAFTMHLMKQAYVSFGKKLLNFYKCFKVYTAWFV